MEDNNKKCKWTNLYRTTCILEILILPMHVENLYNLNP